jgi:hypothetical protein
MTARLHVTGYGNRTNFICVSDDGLIKVKEPNLQTILIEEAQSTDVTPSVEESQLPTISYLWGGQLVNINANISASTIVKLEHTPPVPGQPISLNDINIITQDLLNAGENWDVTSNLYIQEGVLIKEHDTYKWGEQSALTYSNMFTPHLESVLSVSAVPGESISQNDIAAIAYFFNIETPPMSEPWYAILEQWLGLGVLVIND